MASRAPTDSCGQMVKQVVKAVGTGNNHY